MHDGDPLPLSVAIGVGMIDAFDTAEKIMERADEAMYARKAAALVPFRILDQKMYAVGGAVVHGPMQHAAIDDSIAAALLKTYSARFSGLVHPADERLIVRRDDDVIGVEHLGRRLVDVRVDVSARLDLRKERAPAARQQRMRIRRKRRDEIRPSCGLVPLCALQKLHGRGVVVAVQIDGEVAN